jgi:3-oxoadipate enol-lactonase
MALSGTAKARDGCDLFYDIRANPGRPRLVLVHSLAMSRLMWDEVADRIAEDSEILLLDCRGHGQSSRWPGPYTVDLLVDDVTTILDLCGWPKATIAGCSMGGCVAQGFAAAHPERTHGLALIDTTSWYGPTAVEDWNARAMKAAEHGFASMLDFQVSRWFSDGFRDAHPDRVAAAAEIFVKNDARCYRAACEMLGHMDLRTAVKTIRVPTAVVVGREDYATPLAMAEALHDAIPGSTLTVLEAGRHLTPVQCPEEIADLLRTLTGSNIANPAGPRPG